MRRRDPRSIRGGSLARRDQRLDLMGGVAMDVSYARTTALEIVILEHALRLWS
jgi:hypothetical protein